MRNSGRGLRPFQINKLRGCERGVRPSCGGAKSGGVHLPPIRPAEPSGAYANWSKPWNATSWSRQSDEMCRGPAAGRCRSKRQTGAGSHKRVCHRARRSAVNAQGADPGVRPHDQRLPPFQQNEQGARRDSRRWPPAGYRSGRRLSLIQRFFCRTEIFADRGEQKGKIGCNVSENRTEIVGLNTNLRSSRS